MRTNRVVVLFDDHEMQALLNQACDVPLSKWIRKKVLSIPRGEELAAGEASARSSDASAERRLPKAAVERGYVDVRPKPQKSIPVDLPKLDMSICPHNMTKAACPRCK